MKWTEAKIGRELAINHFNARHLVIVPNCSWTGHEADLLVVTKGLNLMDIEIKISRSDFKADSKKEKWWHRRYFYDRLYGPTAPDTQRQHPPKVYKHYFALPYDIWDDSLISDLPSTDFGILLLERVKNRIIVHEHRQAKENRNAPKLTPQQAIDIARLASLRMWDALSKSNIQ